MSETNPELKNIVEAALLVAGQPLTVEKMQAMFPEGSQPAREDIRAVLDALSEEYAARGVELREIGKGWRVQTREKYAEYVARLLEERPPRYSRALLETLAIIAYRQPVTRGEIEHIRGVSVSTDIIRTLTERGWIKEVGRRDVPGRPALLGTTREFLEHFNLKSLEDLPPLAELRSLDEIGAELANREAVAGEGAAAAPEAAKTGDEPAIPEDAAPAASDVTESEPVALLAHPHDSRG
jgi:segregation and condensation protein B